MKRSLCYKIQILFQHSSAYSGGIEISLSEQLHFFRSISLAYFLFSQAGEQWAEYKLMLYEFFLLLFFLEDIISVQSEIDPLYLKPRDIRQRWICFFSFWFFSVLRIKSLSHYIIYYVLFISLRSTMCKQIIIRNCKTTPILTSPSSPTIPLALPPLPLLLLLLISSKLPLPKCSDTGHIYMTCSWQVIVFPILVSPLCMERIFWTCRVYSAWELLHQNGGSERPAAWHGQSPNLPERHTLKDRVCK